MQCSKDSNLPSDIFLTVIRITENLEELLATRNIVSRRLAYIRSKESGSEDDISAKQELNSLLYMKKILDTRIIAMQEGLKSESDSTEQIPEWNRLLVPGQKLINLPLDELLRNNIALSYFIDYMTSINAEAYLYFYLNIYGWRVSAEQQISEIELEKIRRQHSSSKEVKRRNTDLGNLKEAAIKIYQQYLSDKASLKLQLDDILVKSLVMRIKNESVKESWFDELQICCYEKLKTEDRFLPAFRRSSSYIKLLAELDLLKDSTSEEDSKSLDSISVSSMNNETELDQASWMEGQKAETQSNSSSSSGSRGGGDLRALDELDGDRGSLKEFRKQQKPNCVEAEKVTEGKEATAYFESNTENIFPMDESFHDPNVIKKLQQGRYRITAEIIETGIQCDKGKTYGIYAVSVTKTFESGYQEKWHIYRRYSDFHDLYQRIKEKYFDLAKIPFPGKKAFHNMERAVLEKRMVMLNAWLHELTKPTVADGHMGLQNLLLAFLEQGDYDKGITGGHISRTVSLLKFFTY